MNEREVDLSRFEPALARLEQIVRELETAELTLAQTLALFEEAVGLTRDCTELLDTAARRVELVTEQAKGELTYGSFQPEE